MKIVYCLNSISHMGGIAVVTIVKANALADIDGNEVWVCVSDYEANELSSRLSPKVKLIDLDIDYYADDWKSRWHVWKGIVVKRREHKRRLRKVLNEINPDIVVSVGQSEKYMISSIKGRWASIRELHYLTDYRRYVSTGLWGRISSIASDIYDFKWKIKGYDRIVLLTDEDRRRNWPKADNVTVIPNPLTLSPRAVSSLEQKRIISAGRLEAQKNYASLIRAFVAVSERHPDWTLEIYGDGSQRAMLQRLIDDSGLSGKAFLRMPVLSIDEKMAEASCFVLTSRFEGFVLVLMEAMSCGLPVVSYDCPCSPKEIVTDGVDGFLVETGNEEMLAERICTLIENPERRAAMGMAAVKKSGNYRLDRIIPLWMKLFESLAAEKRNRC